MSKSKETRTLKVALTQRDILEMTDRAATLHKEANRLRVEAKNKADAYKKDINLMDSEHSKLQGYIYDKEEPRPVECQWFLNRRLKKRILRRLDTMQAVDHRPLEDEDMQEDMFKENEILEDPMMIEPENKTLE
jgi:hypothetical protein